MNPAEQKTAALDQIQRRRDEINKLKKAKFSVTNNQTKLVKKLLIKDVKTRFKVAADVEAIIEIIKELEPGITVKVVSNAYDSPSIIKCFDPETIKSVYISTWAVTEQGLLLLKHLSDFGIKCKCLLDTTHSYKWIFQSGAASLMGENIEFKFTENHSKFQLFEFNDGSYISIVGSMNLSNNPRWENMDFTTDPETYWFYRNFMDQVINEETTQQKKLF